MTLYVLERWLARLAISPYADTFVLKGGMLLAVLDARRPTSDVDLLARRLPNDDVAVIACVRDVARTTGGEEDGVEFLVDTVSAQPIREGDRYAGTRVSMTARVSTATVKLKLDINFGDPVTPDPQRIKFPSQRPGRAPTPLFGYPIETVLAEKISTAVALGEANTRIRDYVDLYTLTGRHELSYTSVHAALDATGGHRGVRLVPLSDVIGDFATVRQNAYGAFRRRLGPDGEHLPAELTEIVLAVEAFVDPLVTGDVGQGRWVPTDRRWE
ncbi:MAG TPA: nucleotidyl transferase AbiEii/AbiGii toxin family protein, partial [Pseudonocardiaceae bacterium]|nr:nucleotidyl transferase AbiEii/AbiGii toxin family protein [Pseudonocardiaceae bacterium]